MGHSFNPRPGTSPGRSRAPLRAGSLPFRFNPRPGTSPGRSLVDSHIGRINNMFQSSAGDKPRPLLKFVLIISKRFDCFNPRPGTSPGRSNNRFADELTFRVSILGRGQAPAAPAYANPGVSVSNEFQSSAGDKPRPLQSRTTFGNPGRKFQSSAGDKPRPLQSLTPATQNITVFQSSAGDKPRPLAYTGLYSLIAASFNPRPGTSPGRSSARS